MCACRLAMRNSLLTRWILKFPIFFGIFMLLIAVMQFQTNAIGLKGFALNIFVSITLCTVPVWVRVATVKKYSQMPQRDSKVDWEITEDHVSTKTTLSSSELAWANYTRVVKCRQGFLLYFGDMTFHWLPAHAFRAPADFERLAILARSKVKRYEEAA